MICDETEGNKLYKGCRHAITTMPEGKEKNTYVIIFNQSHHPTGLERETSEEK